jgi:hypothetical protein
VNELTVQTMDFSARPPSANWETFALGDAPGCHVWVWFKPPQSPQGLALRVPGETFTRHPQPQRITLRYLLHAAGIDAALVAMWSMYGANYPGMQGLNPALDYSIPTPAGGVDPTIVVVLAPVVLPAQPPAVPHVASSPSGPDSTYDRIESDWRASLQIEKQLTVARKSLAAALARVNSLNRDLNADERRNADNRDNADWQDARRWLRDVAARLSRYIRDYDIGFTSAAGQRNVFEATFKQFIEPRQPFDGVEQMQRDYETYRKTLQTLMNNMQSAQAAAERDGEQRAQRILLRISARARAARTQRS